MHDGKSNDGKVGIPVRSLIYFGISDGKDVQNVKREKTRRESYSSCLETSKPLAPKQEDHSIVFGAFTRKVDVFYFKV